jgi:hypothetical protein
VEPTKRRSIPTAGSTPQAQSVDKIQRSACARSGLSWCGRRYLKSACRAAAMLDDALRRRWNCITTLHYLRPDSVRLFCAGQLRSVLHGKAAENDSITVETASGTRRSMPDVAGPRPAEEVYWSV